MRLNGVEKSAAAKVQFFAAVLAGRGKEVFHGCDQVAQLIRQIVIGPFNTGNWRGEPFCRLLCLSEFDRCAQYSNNVFVPDQGKSLALNFSLLE